MRLLTLLLLASAAQGGWLESVQPIITAPERELFLKLPDDAAREKFQEDFWRTRSVTPEEYYRRLAIADQNSQLDHVLPQSPRPSQSAKNRPRSSSVSIAALAHDHRPPQVQDHDIGVTGVQHLPQRSK